ncbi:hypothetical protein TNCT_449901 [Trichonephila clavata]|uniref:Uncharacterized protein n=1 Tax=Trichonephila clavata TaxID=2740835 RepID=A0A8X6JL68_TRICU|nr:hypothetical protein TNCT_449901 [Trichonephila clavata]
MEETSRKDRRGLRKRGNGRKEEGNRAAGRKERNGGTPVLRASAPRPRDDLDPGGRPKRAESAPGWNRVRPFRISGPFPDAAATFPSGALRSVGFFDFSLKRGPLLLAQLFCYSSH